VVSCAAVAPAPDDSLVEACRAGDRDALEALFRRHGPYLSGLLRRLLGASPDIEDLLQATFVRAMAAFPRYRGEGAVAHWLAGIAVLIAREHLRRPEVRRRARWDQVSLVDEPEAPEVSVERRVDGRRLLDRVAAHLDHVSPDQRLAFLLHVVEGYPIATVARMTGASGVATKSRVFLARRALRTRAARDPVLAAMVSIGPRERP
jgi:RNA polymerase sigma-70 factor (ECF subfamily)